MQALNRINPLKDYFKLLALCVPLAWSTSAAAAPPVSGYSRWFDASQITGKVNGNSITTWNDLSTNAAHATVPAGNGAPVFVANAGTESGLPAVYFAKNSGAGNSAALRFTRDSAIRTVFSVFKGNSFLLTDAVAYDFHRPGDDAPADSLWTSWTSPNLTGGSTYVNGTLVNGSTYAMPTSLHNGFNLVEVLTTGNVQADSFNKDRTYHSGNQYQSEVIIYDRVLSDAERLSVETYLTNKWMYAPNEAKIFAFGPGATIGPVVANAAAISWTVPYGSNLAALSPTFTLSPGATCTKISGSTQNFTSPVHYVVNAANFATSGTTTDYTVTVTVAPASSACDILTFGLPGSVGVIDQAARTIMLTVPGSPGVGSLSPTYTLSPSATCSPQSGTTLDFSNSQTYTVTAQNGTTTKAYTVRAQTYQAWTYNASLFILTTPDGANIPAGASETNFPLLVRLNKDSLDFSQAKAGGADLRFATATGAPLAFQIEDWNATAKTAAIWVLIPAIAGNARQEIKMFWGKSDAVSESNGPAVFNATNGYRCVMHLNGNVLDATGSTSPVNGGATPTTAVIGSTAMNLATGDISASNITNFPTGNNPTSTGEVWIRARQIKSGWCMPLAWGNQNAYGWNTWTNQIGFWGSDTVLPVPLTCRSGATVSGVTALAAQQWYHVVYTSSNGTGKIYINGVLDATASGGASSITSPQGMNLGAADGDADVDEARISSVARSANWVKMAYENQKPLQTLVGNVVQAGLTFSATPPSVTMNENTTTTLTGQAGGAQKVYWSRVQNSVATVVATDQFTYAISPGRVTGNQSFVIRFKGIYPSPAANQTVDIPVTVTDTIPDPVFTLNASTSLWDGRQTMTVTPVISNLAALQAAGVANLNYKWSVAGVAAATTTTAGTPTVPGVMTLTHAQGSGPMTVSLVLDNGGALVSSSKTITVQEPASDDWQQRTPGVSEKPVTKQFFARDPNTNNGTIFYRGTQAAPATEVYLKIYTTDTGADVPYATHRQNLVATAYSFAVPIAAGKITYKVTYGTRTGGVDSAPLATVSDLVCGDAYLIEGQSNAAATDNSAPNDTTTTNKWIRTYGQTLGWGYAISKGSEMQVGLWGWYLANSMTSTYNMPVCIINGAVGGTRIDQHQPNPAGHAVAGSLYSKMNILDTLGMVGYEGCHFSPAGYQNFANLTAPLVGQDFYGVVPPASVTAPNLKRAYFTTSARTAITLEFDQNMGWNSFSKANFYLDKVGGKVSSGSVDPVNRKLVTLQLSSAAAATATLDYLEDDFWNQGESVSSLLYGANAIPALTFADVPITPPAPTGLGATAGVSQVGLTWTAAATATGYNVKRSATTGGPYAVIGTTAGATSYTDTTAINGTTYYYVVSASNTGGESSDSNQASATPNTPYGAWATNPAQGLTPGDNDGPLDDPDYDGISNLLEFVLGGAPMGVDLSILPELSNTAGGWVFEYDRSNASRPTATTQVVEYGSDLTGWAPIEIPLTSNAGPVTITPGTTSDHVKVMLPDLGEKVFARLRVSE